MNPADFERDRREAFDRARELHDDNPDLSADLIVSALDDEFAGSEFWPSAEESFRKEVELLVTG